MITLLPRQCPSHNVLYINRHQKGAVGQWSEDIYCHPKVSSAHFVRFNLSGLRNA